MGKSIKDKNLPQLGELNYRGYLVPDLTANDEEGKFLEGHPAVYNQRANINGLFYEVIEPGAFDETNFDDVLFCINHGLDKIPLARSRRNNGNSTMHLKLDEQGIFIRADLDVENNYEAKAVYGSVEREDMDGMSFIFTVRAQRWEGLDTDMPTRYITKVKRVKEVSVVNLAYYEGTDINARSAVLDNTRAVLDNARAQQAELDNSDELEVLKLKAQILSKG